MRTLRSLRRQALDISAALSPGDSSSRSRDQQILSGAEQLGELLTTLEDDLVQNAIETGQDAIGMERRFTNHIGRLYSLVIREHHRPTAGVLERFADLGDEFEAYMTRFRQLLDSDVVAFQTLLREAAIPHLRVPPPQVG